jgi:poly(A) polymerase
MELPSRPGAKVLACRTMAAAAAAAAAAAGAEKVKYLGVSDVISVAAPAPLDEKRTAEMMTFLEQNKRFESRADKQHRETVLATLGSILATWVKNVSLALDPPIVDPASHRAHLFSFGSYRLGVNARDADIDTVCIVPSHIDARRDFFGLSAEGSEEPPETGNQWRNSDRPECILQDTIEKHPLTENLVAVSSAFTPILTFDFSGVEIDVACGVVAHKTLPAVRLAPHAVRTSFCRPSITAAPDPDSCSAPPPPPHALSLSAALGALAPRLPPHTHQIRPTFRTLTHP